MKKIWKFLLMTFVIISALALTGCDWMGEDFNLLELLLGLFTLAN